MLSALDAGTAIGFSWWVKMLTRMAFNFFSLESWAVSELLGNAPNGCSLQTLTLSLEKILFVFVNKQKQFVNSEITENY